MENKYQYTENCREISGFGGEYEDTCRKMVIQGLEWWDRNENADPRFKEIKNVTGIILSDNTDAKSLEDAVVKGFEGLSGAMVHFTINHIIAAKRLGWDKYIQEMEKGDEEE